jgi:formylglycine-generating enzyme required for sulfatase activity
VIPDRADLARDDAVAYVHDVHSGPGLRGVPRGAVKSLRILAYEFGYPGLAGPDKIGRGGPWEVMRILGTVPLERDGSARFRIPASTPVALQALDEDGRAVQLMRSWFAAMPGEEVSCAGCHDGPEETPRASRALAALREPIDIVPWRGPPRGFDFAREVQPVLDHHCVACHDGTERARPDLRGEEAVEGYRGLRLSDLAIQRLHPRMREATGGYARYTPSYEALIPYIRRVGIEDDVNMLLPGELSVDTSELVQLIEKGHGGVRLDAEASDRLVTWIDLNAPCHGTWGEVFPIPGGAHERRMALRREYGGPRGDLEGVPELVSYRPEMTLRRLTPGAVVLASGPGTDRREAGLGPVPDRLLDLGDGVTMRLVRIPAGACVVGDARGLPDESPLAWVAIESPFWMGACEVTNRQYRRFDASHDPGYYAKRHARQDDQGLPLDGPDQPAVRVSWEEAAAFCRWLSRRTGLRAALPTEAEWEYACRAGHPPPAEGDGKGLDLFGRANVAELSFSRGLLEEGKQVTGGLEHLVVEGASLADRRFDDGAVVTAPVGSYAPNAWGLHDLHGNAAEWTRTAYRPYPYREEDGRNVPREGERRVVRGGSFFDRPARCRASFRLAYPPWRKVFNVGFRVVCRE